jgi:hypothetical protein
MQKPLPIPCEQRGLHLLALAASGLLVLRLLYLCRFGIEFSDEGFYLNWLVDPYLYPASVSQFGFVYHPLYLLVDGNLALLRQINLLITLGLGFFLSLQVLVHYVPTFDKSARLILAFMAASTSLSFYALWLPTPNYNSLNLQSLLILTSGLLMAGKDTLRPWLLLGLGGALCFLAKPSSLVLAVPLTCWYLYATGRWSWRGVMMASAVSLAVLLVSALMIDGSLSGFAERIFASLNDAHTMRAGHKVGALVRVGDIEMNGPEDWGYLLVIALTLLLFIRPRMATATFIFASLLTMVLASGVMGLPTQPTLYLGVWLSAPLLAAAGWVLAKRALRPSRALTVSVACFTLLPYAYAFGSGNNYWLVAIEAGIFWVLAAIMLVTSFAPRACMALVSVMVLTTTIIATAAVTYPYRQQQPLAEQTLPITLANSTLQVDPEAADYLKKLHATAARAGFQSGSYMLDMSGRLPTALYALGAKPIGLAWTVGGYEGSEQLLASKLDNVDCSLLAHTWILAEPDGIRPLPLTMLKHYGISIARDYGGYRVVDGQTLYKPINRKQVEKSCEMMRARHG